jgi:hypothetical protein
VDIVADREYISVLERDMSNPAYRKKLEKQQALQGVYPEEFLLGGGSKTAKDILGELKRQPPPLKIPKIGERVKEPIPPSHPAWKNVADPSPEDLARAKAQKDRKQKIKNLKMFQGAQRDAVTTSFDRMARERLVRPVVEGQQTAVEPQSILSPEESNSYKKGGKVSASKRADGCCQRGKTRGKMI